MAEAEKRDVTLPVTAEIRADVRELIASARYAALATLQPGTGDPLCTRVGLATLADGTPLIFVSALAAHTPALLNDPRCSLLVGDPGKGDPLAHPRITIACRAEQLKAETEIALARERYLSAHPKAKLYIGLPDFRFFRLNPQSASFNGGFGRAFVLTTEDLVML